MAKGTAYETSIALDNIGFTERPSSTKPPSPQTVNTSRSSVLSSVVPYLRRLDIGDEMPAHQKVPLLTLRLSSPSFLDSVVSDDITKDPLYVVKTIGTSTTIRRADPWVGNTKTADIDWPLNAPAKGKGVSDGILIQMRGARWKGSETLLRRSTIRSGPRKFNIPNYAHNLKWRRVGASYWCTTSAVKGPIAILDPAIENLPPRMCVFETLHDKYDRRPMLVHHGVSLLLLDYLLVTGLLLVTDIQDWMLVKKFEGETEISPLDGDDAAALRSGLGHVSTSNLQWRKIMFGEPLYPKRSSRSSMSSASDVVPRTPTSLEQMAKIVYGDPIYPTLSIRSSSPDLSSSESDNEDDHMFFSPARTQPPSPSTDSVYYPSSAPTAPPHTHLDPSFYIEHDIPPVPPIPAIFGTPGAGSSRGSSSRPSSSHSTTSTRRFRGLPTPPIPPSALMPRPRSTPPRSMTAPGPSEGLAGASIAHHSLPASRRLPDPSASTSPSTSQPRQLPRPPSPRDSDGRQAPVLGRSRSQSVRSGEKWNSQYGPRSLPAPPTAGSASNNDTTDRRRRRQTLKDNDDDLTRWVHSLTHHQREYAPVPLPQATFDTPPPAYNSIDFHTTVDLPNMPALPPPIPRSLSSSTGR